MNQERRRFDLSTHGHQISHSVVPSTMQPPALSLHTCRAFRTCRGQTCWKIDRTLKEDWNIENTEISYPGISRQATWHMARPSTLFFFLAAKSGDTRWWHPVFHYLYQDLQLRVTVAPQSRLVVSEADSCLSFIQQPFGPLSQVAKLLHPAVSRQRALPKLPSGIFHGISQEMFRQNIQKHWKNVAEDIKIEDVCWVNRLKNKKKWE